MTKPKPRLNAIKRSILYVPGSNDRALAKIPSLDADGFIIDLEDAVAPSAKIEARHKTCEFLKTKNENNSNFIIRINSLNSEWGIDDLNEVCLAGAKTILLPKVETEDDIKRCTASLADKNITLWAMIETPLGVLNAQQIATADERLTCLVMGTSDLVNDLRAQHTPDRLPILYSLSHTILAARAAGIEIIDGVHLNLSDQAAFEQFCKQAKELGFDGKSLIHPSQIEMANKIFAPSTEEINHSHKIIAAYTTALEEGSGVVLLDGNLIENLHVQNAKRILDIAKQINK